MNPSREILDTMDAIYADIDAKCAEIASVLTHGMFRLRHGWFNGHYYKKDTGEWYKSYCPIPEVDVIDLCDVEIHFDKIVVTTKLKRETAIAYSFDTLMEYNFEAYGVEDYLLDFYQSGQTISSMKDKIAVSEEDEVCFSFAFPLETEGEEIFEFVKLIQYEGFYY